MSSKLTREEMQELISALRLTPTSTVNGISLGRVANALSESMAALDSEPVGEFYEDGPLNWYQISDGDRVPAHRRIPLYRHAQQPVVQPAVIPDGYVMVPADLLSELRDWAHPEIEKYCEMWEGRRDSEFPALRKVIADADALLGAAQHDTHALNSVQSVAGAPDRWIPVSERMPEKNQSVLISVNFDSSLVEPLICSARYTGSTFRRGDTTVKPGSGIEQATHWTPLPAAPQEVKS